MIIAWQHYLFFAALAAVALGCLVPNSWLPALPNDKLMHFGAFAVLAALALPLASTRAEGLLALAGVLTASWAIECLQQLVPERRFCWRDMAANAGGVATVGAAAFLLGLL